jgi:hypothetical protein
MSSCPAGTDKRLTDIESIERSAPRMFSLSEKLAPTARRVAQMLGAASYRRCPSRSSYEPAKRHGIHQGHNPDSGALRLRQPRSGVWAARPAVGGYG